MIESKSFSAEFSVNFVEKLLVQAFEESSEEERYKLLIKMLETMSNDKNLLE